MSEDDNFKSLFDTHSTLLVAMEYNRNERDSLKKLLKKIEMDYNHSWPNEDELTAQHRIGILNEIKNVI